MSRALMMEPLALSFRLPTIGNENDECTASE
jgi:hypothetical protein